MSADATQPVIDARSYGSIAALQHLHLNVRRGQVAGGALDHQRGRRRRVGRPT